MTNAVYAVLAARHEDFSASDVATAAGLDPALATVALESLVDEGRAEVLTNGRYFSDVAAGRLRDTAERTLTTYHKQNPLKKAMPRENLRIPLGKAAAIKDFNAVLLWLVGQGVVVAEGANGVRLPGHAVTVPPGWQKAAGEILEVYRAAKYLPPSPNNFQANYPRDVNVNTILSILAENGELVHISDDIYLSSETFAETKALLHELAAKPEGITVATVRDATGSSRKIILPLLEHLDGIGYTRRVGDARVLVNPNPS